jgi:putative flippase GtrA
VEPSSTTQRRAPETTPPATEAIALGPAPAPGPNGWLGGHGLAPERARFVLVGALNTAVGLGLFALINALIGHRTHYLVAVVIAQFLGVQFAFMTQRLIVFRARGGRLLHELLRFWLVYAGGIAANLVVLPLLVEVAGLPVFPAQVIFTFGLAVATYLAGRTFVFRLHR